MTAFNGGNVAAPLSVAALAGVAATAALVLFWSEIQGPAGRILSNPFCQMMLVLGLGAVTYVLLELRGLALERTPKVGRTSWMTGRSADRLVLTQWEALRGRRRAPLTFSVFALPVLGFLGTVIGISGAIGDLGEVFSTDDRSAALTQVLAQLRFAFDTTFVGLAGVLPAALGITLVDAFGDRVQAELGAEP